VLLLMIAVYRAAAAVRMGPAPPATDTVKPGASACRESVASMVSVVGTGHGSGGAGVARTREAARGREEVARRRRGRGSVEDIVRR
jgi:hypothetical protein